MNRDTRLVVKDNALIDASFNLTLIEQRLMLLAIVEARELTVLTPETPIEVKATTYIEQYKIDESNGYSQLAEASRQIFNRQFSYSDRYNDNESITMSRWVNEITYVADGGMVVLYLNRNVISMISRLQEQFTRYHLSQVSEFKSNYSIRLYEVLVKFINVGNSNKYTIKEIKVLLGIGDNEYKSISYLKRDVIDKAVKEVSDKTDITIDYDQFKSGKSITHILFKIKKKPIKRVGREDKNTIDMFSNMTDKQIGMFSDKLSRDSIFQNYYIAKEGDSTQQYALDINNKLLDPFYVSEWMVHLERVGYVPSKKKGA
jgi:plasmid replication initiation protein